MKRIALIALATLMVACGARVKQVGGNSVMTASAANSAAEGGQLEYRGPKKRVAIVGFENKATYAKRRRVGDAIVDILTTELQKSDAFIMIERAKLEEVLKEQALGQSGAINRATAAKAGRVLGAQALVMGAISEFGVRTEGTDLVLVRQKKQIATATIDVRVVDAQTGEILLADSGKGQYEQTVSDSILGGGRAGYNEELGQRALRAAVQQFIQNLVSRLEYQPWQGRVIKVSPAQGIVYVNAGRQTGLQIGDRLEVRSLGEVLTDPETGVELGQAVGPVVGELEVVKYTGPDAATCRMISGQSAIQSGYQVQLKKLPIEASAGQS